MTLQDVLAWIAYYEQGGEIPDEPLVELLAMAQQMAKLTEHVKEIK